MKISIKFQFFKMSVFQFLVENRKQNKALKSLLSDNQLIDQLLQRLIDLIFNSVFKLF